MSLKLGTTPIADIFDSTQLATRANIDLSNLSSTGEAKFQAPLTSGTNIKTINSTSILGSGNISVGTVTSVNNVSPTNGNVTLSIPTVNNATLTIQKNGTTVNTFTANASSDVTANISVPTQASDIGAQETLVSGTNIKTVNNTSLLGSGNIIIPGINNLFDFKWTDHALNDQSWLQANGSWCSGTTYSDAYNHLVADISGITAETETIAGYTVTFYRAADGHKICLADQENLSYIYTLTGVLWYYILDTTNTRFKLPKSRWGFVGYRNGVGDYVAPALPNITGYIGIGGAAGVYNLASTTTNYGGALYPDTTHAYGTTAAGATVTSAADVGIDASLSNSIYQNNATVQPPATQMYLYFYVGEFSQTATEQTAGLNSQLFNGKADTDLGNMTNAAKIRVAHNAMPSGTYDDLTLGASGTSYTAPADGYFCCRVPFTTNQAVTFYNNTQLMGNQATCNGSWTGYTFIMAKKGDVVYLWYNCTPNLFRFVYAVGAESEA